MAFTSRRPYVVVFPGAWGNHTRVQVGFWCGHVGITAARAVHGTYRPVTYKGNSIDEIAQNVARELTELPPGSIAIAYSMGAQVLRAVIPKLPPGTFARIVLISGLTRFGITIPRFIHIALVAFRSFVASLLTGRVYLRSEGDYRRLMGEIHSFEEAKEMMHEEPMWMKIAQVFLPGFRREQPPIPGSIPTFALMPKDDAIVGFCAYPDEHVRLWQIPGGHDAIMRRNGASALAAEWLKNGVIRPAYR